MTERLDGLATRLGERLVARGWRLATAESCTGGWIAKVATDIPGSSGWFDRGFVSYSNGAKQDMLGVRPETLEAQGAVSEATVMEMAAGAIARSGAQVAVAVSGIAGPAGGSPDKPVGTVCFAWALPGHPIQARRLQFAGHRDEVRHQAVRVALELLLEHLD
ncbi:MAG: CinA family protein [Bdellovibrio bacteriovorus]